MPKFESRSSVGVLVGYHLQPGGEWKNEFLVFPRERFVNFDFEVPRKYSEMRPVRTQEVRLTDAVPHFMMKEAYDRARRTLSPPTFIKDVTDEQFVDADILDAQSDEQDNENLEDQDPQISDQDLPSDSADSPPVSSSELVPDPSDLARHPRFHHWRYD